MGDDGPGADLPAPPEVRASDADRDRAASELREHYAQGRLDRDELGERLERTYAARTTRELADLRADLPTLPPPDPNASASHAERRAELSRRLLHQTGAGLVPFLVCTAVWFLIGASGDFWPKWAVLVALVPLLRNGWHLYGPAPDLDRVADDLDRRRRR